MVREVRLGQTGARLPLLFLKKEKSGLFIYLLVTSKRIWTSVGVVQRALNR